MSLTRLDRYVVTEMAWPLLFGIAAFTSLFMSGDLLNMANLVVEIGAPVGPALRAFLLGLPQVIVWTLPMSVLLATLLSLSRLSGNSEIVAMRAGGVSFVRIALPVWGLALLVSVAGFLIGEMIAPQANFRARQVLVEEVRGGQLPTVTRHVVIKGERGDRLDWFLYANRYDSRTSTFYDATMVYLEGNQPHQTVYADRIVWERESWMLVNGVSYQYGPDGNVLVATYPSHTRPVDLGQRPEDVARLQKAPEEMGVAELTEHIEVMRSQGADVRALEVQKHLKYSIPLASLIFSLIGVPLGVQSHRSASSIGFGLSIVIIFIYYVLMTLGSALGQAGVVPPLVGAWMQNILLGGYGLWLFFHRLSG